MEDQEALQQQMLLVIVIKVAQPHLIVGVLSMEEALPLLLEKILLLPLEEALLVLLVGQEDRIMVVPVA